VGAPDPARGRIEVRGLRVVATHGVLAEEQARPQPFEIDVDLDVDLASAAASDDLAETVDYGAVVDRLVAVVAEGPQRHLLESLADELCRVALAADDRVTAATIAVRKVRPPVAADVATVGVRMTRSRSR
jgi:dihydroneopterin aldolase